jgi:hypothetical protein
MGTQAFSDCAQSGPGAASYRSESPGAKATAVTKVAQIFNLLYRRFVIGKVPDACCRFEHAHGLQNPILRYSRLKICATLSLALRERI